MYRKYEDMEVKVHDGLRGGNGKTAVKTLFKESEMGGGFNLCAELTVEPGASLGLHEHVGETEIYYIVKGTGIVEDDGVKTQVKPGDAVVTGGGGKHCIENNGSEPLVFFAVIAYDK